MAKIIYGVSGQGFGHSTRSKEILRHLILSGHEVLVFTYNQALFFLENEFNVFEVPGLGLSYRKNKVVYWQTFYKNVLQVARQSKRWKNILQTFRDFDPDLVITDFEPVTTAMAKLQRVPLISIDNQHQLTNTRVQVPVQYKNSFLTDKLVIKSMVWGAKYYLVTTFFNTPVIKKNTFLFPPIVRQEIKDLKPQKKNFILVYQNSQFEHIIKKLKEIDYRFVIFGMNREGQEGNIIYKNYDHNEWLKSLGSCRAVMGTAGLSLISESLYLGKPYLAMPVKKQTEQIINAQYIEKMNFGLNCLKFSKRKFEEFIEKLPSFENSLKQHKMGDETAILKKLDELIDNLC